MQIKHMLTLIPLLGIISCSRQDFGSDTEITVPVSVKEIKPGSIEACTSTTGTVYPVQQAALKSELAGVYKLLTNPATGKPYALGDRVTQNGPIIVLEDKEFESGIKVKSQKLNLDISKQEYEKQQSLYEKGGVTLLELKNAELAYVNAQYNYDNALVQEAKMRITAPFGGIITALPYYTPGTRVPNGSDMVTVMNYDRLYMEASLPARILDTIRENQPVRIMNYTLPDDTLNGTITQVSPAIDATTRTFTATMMIDNADLKLRPGMFVKSDIITAKKDSVIVIPKEIILSRQRGKTVYVVMRSNADERVIETGLENLTHAEVVKGLHFDERLITSGFETLQNRSKVKVIR